MKICGGSLRGPDVIIENKTSSIASKYFILSLNFNPTLDPDPDCATGKNAVPVLTSSSLT
jgi:hypothetical protein